LESSWRRWGLPVNARKTSYTTAEFVEGDEPKLYSAGTWTGGLGGRWEPKDTDPVAFAAPSEPIRYLGVHFALGGGWGGQVKILEEALATCLRRLTYRDLTRTQLAYVINAVILPKLSWPLAVSAITSSDRDLTSRLDMAVRTFIKEYMRLPPSYCTSAFYAPASSWGLGIHSLSDLVLLSRE